MATITGIFPALYGKYSKIQILTMRELFKGKQPNIPLVATGSGVKNHRLKAVALVTGYKPCSGRRPAKCRPAPSGLQEVDGLNHLL